MKNTKEMVVENVKLGAGSYVAIVGRGYTGYGSKHSIISNKVTDVKVISNLVESLIAENSEFRQLLDGKGVTGSVLSGFSNKRSGAVVYLTSSKDDKDSFFAVNVETSADFIKQVKSFTPKQGDVIKLIVDVSGVGKTANEFYGKSDRSNISIKNALDNYSYNDVYKKHGIDDNSIYNHNINNYAEIISYMIDSFRNGHIVGLGVSHPVMTFERFHVEGMLREDCYVAEYVDNFELSLESLTIPHKKNFDDSETAHHIHVTNTILKETFDTSDTDCTTYELICGLKFILQDLINRNYPVSIDSSDVSVVAIEDMVVNINVDKRNIGLVNGLGVDNTYSLLCIASLIDALETANKPVNVNVNL